MPGVGFEGRFHGYLPNARVFWPPNGLLVSQTVRRRLVGCEAGGTQSASSAQLTEENFDSSAPKNATIAPDFSCAIRSKQHISLEQDIIFTGFVFCA
jgi:hypothetical protein